jgi:glutathione S-transferase
MKLIGSLSSPYVRKVRIVMAEKKLDYQFVEENVWESDAILASNPLGKVPCLVMEGGEAVFDSRVIVEYLDARSPSRTASALRCAPGKRSPTAWSMP